MSIIKNASDLKPPLQAVLFDLGGTLIYFRGEWPEVLAHSSQAMLDSLNQAGIVVKDQGFLSQLRDRLSQYRLERDHEFIEYTTAYILRNLLAEWGYSAVQDAVLQEALRAMYQVSQASWQPEEDAAPTLDLLRSQGYRLGLISNAADDSDVQTLIDNAGLRPYFEVILSSAAVGVRKPNPRIFQMALTALQVEPAAAVMVGDALGADILGAHNAGMAAVWITRRADTAANRAHLDTVQPEAVITDLSELPVLLAASA